jgi:serine protease DegS
MPGKLLRSILIGLIVGGLLLALMPSLRQWQLTPTTQNDTADDSPPAITPPFAARRPPW